MIDLTTLSDLIDLLNEKGVKVYEEPDVKLVLGGVPSLTEVTTLEFAKTLQDVDKPRKLVKKGEIGSDGLHYEQQVELYGKPLDATPDIYEE